MTHMLRYEDGDHTTNCRVGIEDIHDEFVAVSGWEMNREYDVFPERGIVVSIRTMRNSTMIARYPLVEFREEEVSDHILSGDPPSYTERYEDNYDIDLDRAQMEANIEIARIFFEGSDPDWIYWGDACSAARVEQHSFPERLHQWNATGPNDGTIRFPNRELALIWVEEITGQISDGAWENRWFDESDSWEDWVYVTVEVDEDLDHVEFEGNVSEILNFTEECTRYEGMIGRMLFLVRTSGINSGYTREDLLEDISLLDSMTILEVA